MSRLSRPNLRGRESVFTRGPDIHRGDIHATCPADLAECVMSLEDCCEETHAAQTLLRSGTQDLSRITRVLESQRLFLLVDEGTVKRYKSEISEEIEPAVSELIERAEEGLKALHRKENQLKAKVDAAKVKPPRPTAGMTMAAQKLEQRRLNMLVKQREQLESQLKALESEVKALEKGDERNR
ncbi:dash complex subunit spc19 [Moniliophthora roreri]|nr:dash complex subunit spc19 [Moniliophthora roreri]